MKTKILFICLGNSCRSIMAEALARKFFGEAVAVASAGLYSKGLEEIRLEDCRLLINLTDYSLAGRIPPPLQDRLLHRPVIDPYGCGLEVYRQVRESIRRLTEGEIAELVQFSR